MKTALLRHASDVTTIIDDTRLNVCPEFIHNYGLGYYVNVWKTLQAQFPQYTIGLSIPCGDNVGLAMGAMKAQVTCIRFAGPDLTLAKLATMAAPYGIYVERQESAV